MLNMSSDCYTVWNFRRQILIKMKNDITEENKEEMLPKFTEVCENELRWLEGLMPAHPKSYWVWLHRKLMMGLHPKPNWRNELALCTRALDLDQRNCIALFPLFPLICLKSLQKSFPSLPSLLHSEKS